MNAASEAGSRILPGGPRPPGAVVCHGRPQKSRNAAPGIRLQLQGFRAAFQNPPTAARNGRASAQRAGSAAHDGATAARRGETAARNGWNAAHDGRTAAQRGAITAQGGWSASQSGWAVAQDGGTAAQSGKIVAPQRFTRFTAIFPVGTFRRGFKQTKPNLPEENQ